jgi:hypothetical protein
VFDKQSDRTFRTSPENILQARDFNTFEDGGVVHCLEDGMGSVEDRAAPALRKVTAERSLAGLSTEERAAIMVFTALQKVRGVNTRAAMVDMVEQIRERLRANGDDPDLVPQLQGGDDPEQVKLSSLMLVGRNLAEFARSYANKVMLLFEAAPGATFLLGDTPVVLANQNDTRPYGNLGLEVTGIEIYLPIAPDLTLAFWCPSLVASMEDALRQCEASRQKLVAVALLGIGHAAGEARRMQAELNERAVKIRADLATIERQEPLKSSQDDMDYLNSLQVGQAERHVISSTGDFSLVQRMISDNEKHRRGLRSELV